MPASTRATTGNSRPRVFPTEPTVSTKPRTKAGRPAGTTKKTTGVNKNTKKTKTTPTHGVGKIAAKVEGAALKAEGKVTGSAGKKAVGTAKMHHTAATGTKKTGTTKKAPVKAKV